MQTIIFLTCLFGISIAAPQFQGQQHRPQYREPQQNFGQRNPPIAILRLENENDGDGNYRYAYETENGITAHESGYLRNRGTDNEIQTVEGAYQYYDPDGQLIKLTYTADENGFVPKGDHLPTPPPIPPEIQKALAIIYANAERQIAAANAGQRNRYQ